MTPPRQIRAAIVLAAALVALTAVLPQPATAASNSIPITRFEARTNALPIDWSAGAIDPQLGGDTHFTQSTADNNPPAATLAGAHPALNMRIDFCDSIEITRARCSPDQLAHRARDFVLELPPGALGNPAALPKCSEQLFVASSLPLTSATLQWTGCPASTAVGWVYSIGMSANTAGTSIMQGGLTNPQKAIIFNLPPQPGEVARLGTLVNAIPGANLRLPSVVSIVPGSAGQYRVRSVTRIPPTISDGLLVPAGAQYEIKVASVMLSLFGDFNPLTGAPMPAPFWVNPTHCPAVPERVHVAFDSHEAPGSFGTADAALPITDCANVPFDPSIEIEAEHARAGQPAGYTVSLNVPSGELPRRNSHIRRVDVTLPEGVGLSPGAAAGLEACSDSQFSRESAAPVRCPAGSQIGEIEVETPYLDGDPTTPELDTIPGRVFFGEPSADDRWRLFLLIEGAGLRVKVAGRAIIDERTGRIRNVFDDLPQTPFTRFSLRLRDGARAILTNPRRCGEGRVLARVTPWSGTPEVEVDDSIETTGDGSPGSACPAPRPLAPVLSTAYEPSKAGAHSRSHIEIENPDGGQLLKSLQLALPMGAIGSLKGIALCPAAQVSGGGCSVDSRIGRLSATVGSGAAPLSLPGTLYLGEPLQSGDVASLSVVVPARVGPIDLGDVVLASRVYVRRSDAGIDTITTGIPTVYKGVPQVIRRLVIDVDRERFWRNPTGCDLRPMRATLTGDEGGEASAETLVQATECEALAFAPQLELIAEGQGQTKRFQHTGLKAIVRQQAGEANIRSAKVTLPDILRPDNVPLLRPGGVCSPPDLGRGACPPQSRVGWARVTTPLLPGALAGPVHVVQYAGVALPGLAVSLSGAVSIQLNATNALQSLRTVNTFESVPDVPVSGFELLLEGGTNGLLKNFRDLCREQAIADATFTSHSGSVYTSRPELKVRGCSTRNNRAALRSRKVRMSKKGMVRLRLACEDGPCSGTVSLKMRRGARRSLGAARYEIDEGETKAVRVRLTKAGRRIASSRRRTRMTATIKASGPSVVGALTVTAARK